MSLAWMPHRTVTHSHPLDRAAGGRRQVEITRQGSLVVCLHTPEMCRGEEDSMWVVGGRRAGSRDDYDSSR